MNRLGGHKVGEPVAAQQIAVTGLRLREQHDGLDLVAAVERLQQQGALRVVLGLLRRQPALVDEALHERLVQRQLLHRAVAQPIGAGVADLGDADSAAVPQDRGQRRAHALELLARVDREPEALVRRGDASLQDRAQVGSGLLLVQGEQCGDDRAARDLAGGVTAHAVGDDEQARADVRGVLVVGADQAHVGAGGGAQGQGHARYFRSSSSVLPTLTGTPIGTTDGEVTFCLSR